MVQQKTFMLINGSVSWNENSWVVGSMLRIQNTPPLKIQHTGMPLFITQKINSVNSKSDS